MYFDYIKKKYGSEKVCQISTLGSNAKAVLARHLGIAYTHAAIARMIPDKLSIRLNIKQSEENLESRNL